MAEYRLSELASRSGVSARNIRAYRERDLLDPPRRDGRSAFYDDHHLAQLKMINELLRRGFTSVHIAEFFAGLRRGQDLVDILGLKQAIFGDRRPAVGAVVRVDSDGDEADRLLATGLAEDVDGEVLVTPRLAEIVGRAADPPEYVRVMLRVLDGIETTLDVVAESVVRALEDSLLVRFGPNYVPLPQEVAELRRILTDYRALGSRVVADQLDAALQKHVTTAVSSFAADAVLGGHRAPAES